MKRFEQDRLLDEFLREDGISALRQSSLEEGLAAIRGQRARRRTGRTLAWVLPVAFISAMILLGHQPRIAKPTVAKSSTPPELAPGIKMISDEELFALFPNRSMALIGKPGQQQLVFFDRPGVRRQ